MFKYSLVAVTVAKYVSGQTFDSIAGYVPASDVVNHNLIDLDQAEIAEGPVDGNFSAMQTAYSVGGNSVKSSGSIRTLQGFSTGLYGKAAGIEPFFDAQVAYFDDEAYGDTIVTGALEGTGLFADAAESLRKEVATKGSAYVVAGMYAMHEMEDAIADCSAGSISSNDDGVHAWDEAVAFYTGSLEGTLAGGNSDGELSYRLAEKRCANYGTCTGAYGVEGISAVNKEIFELFNIGQSQLQVGNCDDAQTTMENIQSLMLVPLIQGMLRYAWKGDAAAADVNGYDDKSAETIAKEQGEGYIFTMGVIGIVDQCDSSVSALLESNLGLTADTFMADGYVAVTQGIQSVYECLGITCTDVGGLLLSGSTDEFYVGLGPCADADVDSVATVTPAASVLALLSAYALI